jgi:transketolase C-terminal domain/subunit
LDAEEQERIKVMKSTLPEPHFFKLLKAEGEAVGEARGERIKALDTARKLLEHGVSWDIITNSTGIKPADLKKAAKAAPARKLAKK